MCRHWLARPEWTDFVCSVVADREHKAEVRRVRFGKLVPRFAASICRTKPRPLNLTNGFGSHGPGGMTPCAECREVFAPLPVHDRHGHDRTRGVAGAEKENVVVWHGSSLCFVRFDTSSQAQQFGPQQAADSPARGFGASQELPYAGKLRLKGEVANREADMQQTQADLLRSSIADQVKALYLRLAYPELFAGRMNALGEGVAGRNGLQSRAAAGVGRRLLSLV